MSAATPMRRRMRLLAKMGAQVDDLLAKTFLSESDLVVVLDPRSDAIAAQLARTRRPQVGVASRERMHVALGSHLAAQIEAGLAVAPPDGMVYVVVIAHGGATMLPVPLARRHDAAAAN